MRAVNQPQSWWGWHGWDKPEPMSLVQLMRAGTLTPRLIAAFWLGLERGASFIFAADPPGSGKTTVLTALLALAPPDMVAYFTRGWGETFELPPPSDSHATYMMVNEMSDHLPVYSWGPYVVRIFELLSEGYSLLTTVHADTVEDVIAQLEDELDVAPKHIARLTFIVPLAIERRDGGKLHRVRDVGLIGQGADGIDVNRIASWDARQDSYSVLDTPDTRTAFAERLDIPADEFDREFARRETFIAGLSDGGIDEIDAEHEAIEAFWKDA